MTNDGTTKKNTEVRDYIIVALILGAITYVEFAIVEFDFAWLSSSAVLWLLMILSVVKFVMVVMFFMHLKNDDPAYTGFFGTGMLMALATFVAFAFLMTAPASVSYFRASGPPGAEGPTGEVTADGLDDASTALIESDGYSRSRAEIMDAAPPKDQSLAVEPPAAPEGDYTLAEAPAGGAPPATDEAGGEGEAAAAGGNGGEAQSAAGGWDEELGAQVFGANCASCHQQGGQGIPGAFPPLADHAAAVAGIEGGRSYVVDAVLFGLQGSIDVDGATYNGVMPAWAQLGDDQVAAVVNHAIHLGDGGDAIDPITVDEVAGRRGEGLSAQDVHAARESLALP